MILPDVASRQRRRHGAVKVLHHRVRVTLGRGLMLERLQMVESQQLRLARRVQLTMGDVKQRPQRRTAFASLLPRRRPRHLSVYTIRRVLLVTPDLELPRRGVIAESTVTLHRCTLFRTIVDEYGPRGAPLLLLALGYSSILLFPLVFHQVLSFPVRERQRQAASATGAATARQISGGRAAVRIQVLPRAGQRIFFTFRTSACHVSKATIQWLPCSVMIGGGCCFEGRSVKTDTFYGCGLVFVTGRRLQTGLTCTQTFLSICQRQRES